MKTERWLYDKVDELKKEAILIVEEYLKSKDKLTPQELLTCINCLNELQKDEMKVYKIVEEFYEKQLGNALTVNGQEEKND